MGVKVTKPLVSWVVRDIVRSLVRPFGADVPTTFFDDFDRPDQALTDDPRYVQLTALNAYNIVNKRLRSASGDDLVGVVFDTGLDFYVEFETAGGTNNSFITLRFMTQKDYIGVRASGTTAQIYSCTNGAFASLASASGVTSGSKVRFEIIGDTIKTFVNGTLRNTTRLSADNVAKFTGTSICLHARSYLVDQMQSLRIGKLTEFSA